jgi:hypothetical protein
LSIISPLQYLSDDALVGGVVFPNHFFGQKLDFCPNPGTKLAPTKRHLQMVLLVSDLVQT